MNIDKIMWAIIIITWLIVGILHLLAGENAEGSVACVLLAVVLLKMK